MVISEEKIKIEKLVLSLLDDGQEHSFKEIKKYVIENAKNVDLDISFVKAPRISSVMYKLYHNSRKCIMTRNSWYRIYNEPTFETNTVVNEKEVPPVIAIRNILKQATDEIETVIINDYKVTEQTDKVKAQHLFEYGMEIKQYLWKAQNTADRWLKHNE